MDEFVNALIKTVGRQAATRFCSKIRVSESGCWQWTAGTSRGYGVFHYGPGAQGAHRFAYQHTVGPVPDGLVLDHWACDNRGCVNPAHVRPVSQRENILRGSSIAAQRAAKKQCLRGHAFTEENTLRTGAEKVRHCRACNAARAREYRVRKRAIQ